MMGSFVSSSRVNELVKLVKFNQISPNFASTISFSSNFLGLERFLNDLEGLPANNIVCGHVLMQLSHKNTREEYLSIMIKKEDNFFAQLFNTNIRQDDKFLNCFFFYLYRNLMRKPFSNFKICQNFTSTYAKADRVFFRVFPKLEEQYDIYRELKPVVQKYPEVTIEYFQSSSLRLDLLKPFFYLRHKESIYPIFYLKARQFYSNENCHLTFFDLLYNYRVFRKILIITDMETLKKETEDFLSSLT